MNNEQVLNILTQFEKSSGNYLKIKEAITDKNEDQIEKFDKNMRVSIFHSYNATGESLKIFLF